MREPSWYIENPKGTMNYEPPRVVSLISWVVEDKATNSPLFKLTQKRRELGYTSPCMRSPTTFDSTVEFGFGREGHQYRLNRLRRASLLCMDCEVLPECTRLLNSLDLKKPLVTGMLAGQLVLDSTSEKPDKNGMKIRKIIDKERGNT